MKKLLNVYSDTIRLTGFVFGSAVMLGNRLFIWIQMICVN